jgi:hypothetical protein
MADPGPDPDSENDPGARLDRGSTTSTIRLVRLLGIVIAIALIALIAVLHLTGVIGGGLHQ